MCQSPIQQFLLLSSIFIPIISHFTLISNLAVFFLGPLQPGQAPLQILPPSAASEGPAPHQRAEPPRPKERGPPAVRPRRAAAASRTDAVGGEQDNI